MAISKSVLNDGERVVVSTRTHPKALLLPVLALVVLLAVGVLVQGLGLQVLTLVAWVVVLVGIVWWVLRPFLVWLTASYTVTDRRLITRTGVLTRRGHDIPLSRISDIASERDLVDRMLGCGTLIISDASTDGEVRLPDIPQVEDAQRRLNDLLQTPQHRGTHDGS